MVKRLPKPILTNGADGAGIGSAGFVEHHDPHDVFAIQLHGAKRWSVAPPIVTNPSHRYRWRDIHRTAPQELQQFVTRQGEALYIPLGWRHFATPADGDGLVAEDTMGVAPEAAVVPRSVHVTMGVQLPRWGDLIEGACSFVSILMNV